MYINIISFLQLMIAQTFRSSIGLVNQCQLKDYKWMREPKVAWVSKWRNWVPIVRLVSYPQGMVPNATLVGTQTSSVGPTSVVSTSSAGCSTDELLMRSLQSSTGTPLLSWEGTSFLQRRPSLHRKCSSKCSMLDTRQWTRFKPEGGVDW